MTAGGTSVSSVSALAGTRVDQIVQYCSPVMSDTIAASRNDEMAGAVRTAPMMNTAIRRRVSNRSGRSLNVRTMVAAISASEQFVMKSSGTIRQGLTTGSSTSRWAGKTASR